MLPLQHQRTMDGRFNLQETRVKMKTWIEVGQWPKKSNLISKVCGVLEKFDPMLANKSLNFEEQKI